MVCWPRCVFTSVRLCEECFVEVSEYIGDSLAVVLCVSTLSRHTWYQLFPVVVLDVSNALQVFVLIQYAIDLALVACPCYGSDFFADELAQPTSFCTVRVRCCTSLRYEVVKCSTVGVGAVVCVSVVFVGVVGMRQCLFDGLFNLPASIVELKCHLCISELVG